MILSLIRRFRVALVGLGLIASAIGSFWIYDKIESQISTASAYVPKWKKLLRRSLVEVTHSYALSITFLGSTLVTANLIVVMIREVMHMVRVVRS